MSKIYEIYGSGGEYAHAQSFIAGLECEIESIRHYPEKLSPFTVTNDGSLRNNGYEFISMPLDEASLITAFKNLHAKLEFRNKDDAFSSRTSTHVHINCSNLETSQVKTITLLYALYEEFFFAMVDPIRRGNIHCVPLTETFLPTYYKYELNHMVQRWHKYTALNLLPLGKLGTIEFRHLQGTDDDVLMGEWIRVLSNLWNLGQRVQLTPETLSDSGVLKLWFRALFDHVPRIMALEPCLDEMTKNSLLDVKLSLV
jgi:hypothetical protein